MKKKKIQKLKWICEICSIRSCWQKDLMKLRAVTTKQNLEHLFAQIACRGQNPPPQYKQINSGDFPQVQMWPTSSDWAMKNAGEIFLPYSNHLLATICRTHTHTHKSVQFKQTKCVQFNFWEEAHTSLGEQRPHLLPSFSTAECDLWMQKRSLASCRV